VCSYHEVRDLTVSHYTLIAYHYEVIVRVRLACDCDTANLCGEFRFVFRFVFRLAKWYRTDTNLLRFVRFVRFVCFHDGEPFVFVKPCSLSCRACSQVVLTSKSCSFVVRTGVRSGANECSVKGERVFASEG